MTDYYIECHNRQESEAVLKLLEEHTDIKWNMGQLPTKFTPKPEQHYIVLVDKIEFTRLIWRDIEEDKTKDPYLSEASEITYQDLLTKYVGHRMLL